MVAVLPRIKDISNDILYYEKAVKRIKNTRASQILKIKTIHDRDRLLYENNKLNIISFQLNERIFYLKFYKKLLRYIKEFNNTISVFDKRAFQLHAESNKLDKHYI